MAIEEYEPPAIEELDVLIDTRNNMSAIVSKEAIRKVYEEIHDDDNPMSWLILKYTENGEGNRKVIYMAASGTEYEDFLKIINNDNKLAYGFANIRFTNVKKEPDECCVVVCWVGKNTKCVDKLIINEDRDNVAELLPNHEKMYITGNKSEIEYKRITFMARLGKF